MKGEIAELRDGKLEVEELIREIQWVRLVRRGDWISGIGLYQDNLIRFLSTDPEVGWVEIVSARDSVLALLELARIEADTQPDVETNSTAWLQWLEALAVEATDVPG